MANRYDADWQGVALALRQLKEIAAPSELDILEKKQEFAEEQTIEQRQWDEKQKGYERAHSLVETMVEKGYETWTKNQAKITTLRDDILKMDASAEKFVGTEHETKGFGIVFEGLNLTKLEDTMQISKKIEENIGKQLKTLGEFQNYNNFQNLGKQIYDQGNMDFKVYKPKVSDKEDPAGWELWQEKTKDYEVLIDEKGREYKQIEDWDFTGSQAGVEEWEYNAAITNIQKEMEEKGEDPRGLEGGFWQGFKNEENQATLAEIDKLVYKSSLTDLNRDRIPAEELIGEYDQINHDLSLMDKKFKEARSKQPEFIDRMARMRESIIRQGKGHLLKGNDGKRQYEYNVGSGGNVWWDKDWVNNIQEKIPGITEDKYLALTEGEKDTFNEIVYHLENPGHYNKDAVVKERVDTFLKAFKAKFKDK